MQFNTDINILGGIPDYPAMMRFVVNTLSSKNEQTFAFRTENATKRFVSSIERSIITCKSDSHRRLFLGALQSEEYQQEQKYIVLFWQLVVNNELFRFISKDYYLRMMFSGRISLSTDEILSYLYELRRENPDDLQWSEITLKKNASKYLTLMKKLGLVEGDKEKAIRYPNIGDTLFVYLVKLSQIIYPEDQSLSNPLLRFSFLEESTLINKIKSIKFTPYWTVNQLGNDINIEIFNYE